MKISEYPKIQSVEDISLEDVLLMESLSSGTKTVDMKTIGSLLLGGNYLSSEEIYASINKTINQITSRFSDKTERGGLSCILRRRIYRGKEMSNPFSEEVLNNVENGTFDDLFIGDYFKSPNGATYIIADFNYFKNYTASGSNRVTKNHVTMITKNILGSSKWTNLTNVSSGYVSSTIRSYTINDVKNSIISNLLESKSPAKLLTYSENLSSAINSSGLITSMVSVNTEVEILSELQAFGSYYYGQNGCDVGDMNSRGRLSYFDFVKEYFSNHALPICFREAAKTNNKISAISTGGNAIRGGITVVYGIIPIFSLCK